MDTSKKDITSIGTTEIVKGEFVFLPFEKDEKCKDFIQHFTDFVGDNQLLEMKDVQDLVDVAIEGICPENEQLIKTSRILSVQKISRPNLFHNFCYKLWFPWGIQQKYLVTTDTVRYVINFGKQSQRFFGLVEAVLHDEYESMKFKKDFI